MGIEVPDQRLHGLSFHQDVLQAHQTIQAGLTQGGGALAGAGVERNAARDLRVRGGDGLGECDLARSFGPKRNWSMTCSKRSFAVVSPLVAALLSLSIGTVNGRDADLTSRSFAAAQTAKQKCINTCRARYRDCRRLRQAPSFQCRDVYQDCTRYSCTGLGPG